MTTYKKIAFFDIDGTITSEIDGSIPGSVVSSIRKARENGNLMFINTGRCFQNIGSRFKNIGFDGYVCGCGTHIICEEKEILYHTQSHDITKIILDRARLTDMDILFEGRDYMAFDISRTIKDPAALSLYSFFQKRYPDLPTDLDAADFHCDKFVIWFESDSQLEDFRLVSDLYFECIDRGGNFREFVPLGYSKASGIQVILDHYGIDCDDAYVFGDSNNDLAMLTYVKNSIAMGNAVPQTLFDQVSYVTAKSSEDGIQKALAHFGFI